MALQALHAYDFDNDPEYRQGMAAILSQIPGDLADDDRQAVLSDAKCFYFSRKHNIDPPLSSNDYATYLAELASPSNSAPPAEEPPLAATSSPPINPVTDDTPTTSSVSTPPVPAPPAPTPQPALASAADAPATLSQPAYPPTFTELMDLITNNKPIPGIEEIPDTVIEDESLAAFSGTGGAGNENQVNQRAVGRRKKPWEKDAEVAVEAEVEADKDTHQDVSSNDR